MFDSNIHSITTEYHSFVTDDIALESIGMASYSLSSLDRYINSPNKDKLLSDANGLRGAGSVEPLSIIVFNEDTKEYELKTGNDIFVTKAGVSAAKDLEDLLKKHNTNEWGIAIDDNVKEIVERIQGSYSGCITFRPSISIDMGESQQTRSPLVKVYLKPKTQSDTTRSLAQNGPPFISSVPKRPTGAKYGWQGTQDKPIGVYQNPHEGGNTNPVNAVAADLRLTYNSAIGEWESGTQQMLARLLTDVDAAKIKDIPFDSIDDAPPSEFYDINSNYYMGQFTIGKALPISVEGGNPHMCGPNMTATQNDGNKKEKIQVVNRAPRSFKKGDVVICSHIDGEWIIQGFDAGTISTEPVSLKIGKWFFGKYLANSDSFFKDERYWSLKDKKYFHSIVGQKYEDYIRTKYYMSMYQGGGDDASPQSSELKNLSDMNNLNDIAKLNLYQVYSPSGIFSYKDSVLALKSPLPSKEYYDFQPTQGYVQVTAFDQVGSHMGGTNLYNIIGRTNVTYAPDGSKDPNQWYQTTFPNFWGPVFTEGYSAQQASVLKQPRDMQPMIGSARLGIQIGDPFFVVPSDGSQILSIDSDKNKTTDDKNFMFSDTKDTNLKQLPAEIGINGSLSGVYSSPIESLDELAILELPNANTLDIYEQYFLNPNRYSWLSSISDSGNIYGLMPAQPSKLQFSPLQLEYAVHAYVSDKPVDQPKYDKLSNSCFETLKTDNTTNQQHLWGSLFSETPYQSYAPTRGLAPFPLIGPDTVHNGEGPLGGPDLLPDSDTAYGDEKSNFVGIIIAKNKFSATEKIGFKTDQYFGLPKVKQVAGGQTGGITILPIGGGVGWVGPSNPSFTYGYPQWGAYEDNVDSFGTTALHVRIFDEWPDEQTIYDPRYFGILHFNPLSSGQKVSTKLVDSGVPLSSGIENWKPTDPLPKYSRSVDQLETSVDFRVPTFASPLESSLDNTVATVGLIVNRKGCDNKALRPPNEWRVNTIRRGRLLTGGGFRYYKRVIGLSGGYMIIDGGKGFEKDQEISLPKGAKCIIDSIDDKGSIGSIVIAPQDRGEGFSPQDFTAKYTPKNSETDYYGLKLDISGGSSRATILFIDGIVYDKMYFDTCPLESTNGPQRLTLPSYRGEKAAEGVNQTTITLASNKNSKYDAFYFFHNDILHTTLQQYGLIPGFHQYVKLEIGSS